MKLKVSDAIEKLNLNIINVPRGEREIQSAYCGDFLSFAISKQGDCCIWFTVMNNVNVAGVASLTDSALIVLCDGILPDDMLLNKVIAQDINIAVSELDVYQTAVNFSKI